jgi:hypothetical protein
MAVEIETATHQPPNMASKTPEIEFVHQSDEKSVSKTQDPEIASVDEPTKGYYSKLSVWLMILFSGLAIGSDGYNVRNCGEVYHESETV